MRFFTWNYSVFSSRNHIVKRVTDRWYGRIVLTACGKEPFEKMGRYGFTHRPVCRRCLRANP